MKFWMSSHSRFLAACCSMSPIMQGTSMGLIKGDTRSLDNGSYGTDYGGFSDSQKR